MPTFLLPTLETSSLTRWSSRWARGWAGRATGSATGRWSSGSAVRRSVSSAAGRHLASPRRPTGPCSAWPTPSLKICTSINSSCSLATSEVRRATGTRRPMMRRRYRRKTQQPTSSPPRLGRYRRREGSCPRSRRECDSDTRQLVQKATAGRAAISETAWLVFYLDARLQTWLLVQKESIVLRRTVDDRLSPFGSHDVIWVRGQAPIRHGSGPQSIQQRFLTGDFTRAGDFDAPPTGGTFSSPSGLLCAAGSPGCCPRNSRG